MELPFGNLTMKSLMTIKCCCWLEQCVWWASLVRQIKFFMGPNDVMESVLRMDYRHWIERQGWYTTNGLHLPKIRLLWSLLIIGSLWESTLGAIFLDGCCSGCCRHTVKIGHANNDDLCLLGHMNRRASNPPGLINHACLELKNCLDMKHTNRVLTAFWLHLREIREDSHIVQQHGELRKWPEELLWLRFSYVSKTLRLNHN